jgi:hypothetical protein
VLQDLIGNPYGEGWIQVPVFLLHMLPMNLLVGGAVMAVVVAFRSEAEARRLAVWLRRMLFVALVWSLVLGFFSLEVLNEISAPQFGGGGECRNHPEFGSVSMIPSGFGYGRVWPLWPFLLLLVVASLLRRHLKPDRPPSRRHATGWILASGAIGASLLCAYALNSDERILLGGQSTPREVLYILAFGSADLKAWALDVGPSLLPRYLHLLLAAVAVTGMFAAIHGTHQRGRDRAYGDWVLRYGARWFAVPTALQLVVGFWFLISLPEPARGRLLGGSIAGTVELIVGVLLAVAVLILMTQAAEATNPRILVWSAAATLGLLLIVMVLLREQVRFAYLEEAYARLPGCRPGPLVLPTVSVMILASGIGLALWLRRRVSDLPPPAGEPEL